MRRAEDAHEPRVPDYSVRTGKHGYFRIQGVRSGRYIIFASSRTHGTVIVDDVEVESGKELFITLSTVKTHIASLMAKIGARNRVEIALWAYRTHRLPDRSEP